MRSAGLVPQRENATERRPSVRTISTAQTILGGEAFAIATRSTEHGSCKRKPDSSLPDACFPANRTKASIHDDSRYLGHYCSPNACIASYPWLAIRRHRISAYAALCAYAPARTYGAFWTFNELL